MRIVCPTCSAAYDVPDSLITAGRTTRCARCGAEWTPLTIAAEAAEPEPVAVTEEPEPAAVPLPEPPAPPAAAAVRPSAMDRLAAHPAVPEPTSMHLRMAWLGSLVLLILLVGAAYAWRDQITAAWPPSARAYAAFGLHPEAATAR